MSTAAYREWVKRIGSGVFTHAQCRQFVQAVVSIAEGSFVRGKTTNLTQEEAAELVATLKEVGGVSLTKEQTDYGVKWLLENWHTKLDLPESVGEHFDHFEFHGDRVTLGPYDNSILPVWRIVLTDGRKLDYCTSPWQAALGGGGPSDRAWWWIVEEPTNPLKENV